MSAADLYETDARAWAEAQADALRRRATNEIGWDNVAEEIEDVAQRNRDRIKGALTMALVHLLKWRFQPEARSNAWKAMVVAERNCIAGSYVATRASPDIQQRYWPMSIPMPALWPRPRLA
jgi:hypothetical protein